MIDKLEMFIALAKAEHFGRAAEECGISQPSLSAAIRQLEEQLGVMLVWRGSRYRGLTPEGARVLEWARQIVADARTMREEMRATKEGLSGLLRIAAIPTALTAASELTAPLSARHPNLRFTVLSRTSAEILRLLEDLEIDAGVTYLDNEPLGRVTTVPLYEERYSLIARSGAPLTDRKIVTWAEAAALPLCLLTQDMQNRRIVNQHMTEGGAEAAPRLESNSITTLMSHVRRAGWATILPIKAVEMFLATGALTAVPLTDPEASHEVGLIAPHREPHTPALKALLDAAQRLGARRSPPG